MFKEEHKTHQSTNGESHHSPNKRHFTSTSQLAPLPSPNPPIMTRLREVSWTTIHLSKICTLCLPGNNTK